MSESRKSVSRRTFFKAAAAVTAGTGLIRRRLSAQGIIRATSAGPNSAFPKIDPEFMITPEQALDWHVFKGQCGPTYAGSTGWKRFTDFLVSKMPDFGAVDLDYVEIPYDHYIVDDWPDRRTHAHDSGIAVEKFVTDGTPVPMVASYGMTSGSTPAEGITVRCSATTLRIRRLPRTSPERSSSSTPHRIPIPRTPTRFWTVTR